MKHFLFDMDGLLLDTEWAWKKAIIIVFEELVPRFDRSFFDHLSGKGIFDITKEFIDNHQLEASFLEVGNEIVDMVINMFVATPRIMLGAKEFVHKTKEKGITCSLVSSSPRRVIDAFLKASMMNDTFFSITSGDDVESVKPAPDIYLKAIREIGVSEKDIIVFEDSIPGVLASKAAKLHTIKVNSENDFDMGQDHSFDSFLQIELNNIIGMSL